MIGLDVSDYGDIIPIILIGFFFGLFLFYKGFFTLKRKKKIEDTPTSKIRGLSLGEVEIYGEALTGPNSNLEIRKLDDEGSISPFTKKECVYYSMQIEEYKKQGKSSKWVPIRSRVYCRPFYVKDETGRVLVDPKGAEFEVPVDFEEVSGVGRDPSKQVQEYLDANKIESEGLFGFNKKLRYTERIIAVKDKVYVFGDAIPSGKMSSMGQENIVINKKGKYGFFFISDRPEKDVVKFFGKRVFFNIYGGAALSTLCLAIFLAIM